MGIVDLSVPIGEQTLSPPSVNLQLQLTSYHRGPGFWQASKIEMLLHTGSHVDFTKHVQEDGETAVDVSLDRVTGEALVVDLSFAQPNHEISVADMQVHAQSVREGDIVLVRTDWTEKHWGNFPTYYLESPYCSAEAARWLVDRGAKAIGFDCFRAGFICNHLQLQSMIANYLAQLHCDGHYQFINLICDFGMHTWDKVTIYIQSY